MANCESIEGVKSPDCSPKKFFERRAIDDSELKAASPELLKVIEDLRPLQKSKVETEIYINKWRKTKYKEHIKQRLSTGEIVEVENYHPDMHIHDRFINWLFDYFHKLYEEKTSKTISYAYALNILTVYHNRQILNRKILLKKEVDLPNTNLDDVLDVIETETLEVKEEATIKELVKSKIDAEIAEFEKSLYVIREDIESVRAGLKIYNSAKQKTDLINRLNNILVPVQAISVTEPLKNVHKFENMSDKELSLFIGKDWAFVQSYKAMRENSYKQLTECISGLIKEIDGKNISADTVEGIKDKALSADCQSRPKMIITTPDRIMRELNLIQRIYDIQFSKCAPGDWNLVVFNENQQSTDGRYLNMFDICSEVELFNIQVYKDEFTHRYENTQNTTLIINQLSKIRDKATEVLNFYNQNLTNKNKIAADFYKKRDGVSTLDFLGLRNVQKPHNALIFVGNDYCLDSVFYGCDFTDKSKCRPFAEKGYNYTLNDNFYLTSVCCSLINFANDILTQDSDKRKTSDAFADEKTDAVDVKKDVVDKSVCESVGDNNSTSTSSTVCKYDIDKEKEVNILENYAFWDSQKGGMVGRVNIFNNITWTKFLEMVSNADFSPLNVKGKSQRVKYNVVILSRVMGKEWGKEAASSLKTNISECQKRTNFHEYGALKGMYLP